MIKYERTVVGALGVNCYVAYCDKTMHGIIIDPGANKRKITELIDRLGVTVDAVVLTHSHFDHSTHAEDMRNAYGVPIIIHEYEKELLANAEWNLSASFTNSPIALSADKYVKDGDEIAFGNEKLKVIYTPGHTRGSMSLYAEGVLFSGDTLFEDTYGRTDFPTGDALILARSIKKLYELPDETVLLPGHNDFSTIGREKKYNYAVQMLFGSAENGQW